MYDMLLIPTDGSDGMTRVAEHGLDLAQKYDAVVHILYAIDPRIYLPVPDSIQDTVKGAIEDEGEQAVQTVVDQAGDLGIETVEMVAEGVPHRAILEYVNEHDIDLIVMGTHGRTGPERQVLGSVAEKTVRLSPIPVHTVRLEDDVFEGTPHRGVM